MFFSKNKKKVDSRARFLNSRFKNRLREARGYKRRARALPQTKWGIFLSRIGLGSWLARFLTLLVLIFLVYIAYIPNFLFIQNINITGLDETAKPGVMAAVNSFLKKQLPWPQKNLLLLSTGGLEEYLLKNQRDVLEVRKISKRFPNPLTLAFAPRVDSFFLQTPLYNYIVSNDGLVTGLPNQDASSTLPAALGLIKLNSSPNLGFGQQALDREKANFLLELGRSLPDIAKSPIDYLEMSDLETPDLTLYSQSGFKIFFDFHSDANETLNRLKVLFSQFTDANFNRLSYVDMRFEGKGYICYKDAACVNDINSQKNPATTTPESLPN